MLSRYYHSRDCLRSVVVELHDGVYSYLTAREQELCRRRAKVEKLLAWKQKLDAEEKEIERLEKEAVQGVASRRASSANDSTVSGERGTTSILSWP